MRNKSKFEIPLVITALIVLVAWLLSLILNNASTQKFTAFKYSAVSFNSVIKTNIDYFQNSNVVYLDEAIDAELIDNIKSPFSNNNCDKGESKVEIENGNQGYITLKCDDFLIEHADQNTMENIYFYEVGKWNNKKNGSNYEKKVLYNCSKNNKLIFDDYVEKEYFIYKINKKFESDYKTIKEIDNDYCNVMSKTFYRTKKEIYDKSN